MNDKNRKEESEAKKKKWFSRRHETAEAYKEAQTIYLSEHGKNARQRKAEERQQIRDARTPKEQLKILDERLGVGQGAQKERTRLQALIKG